MDTLPSYDALPYDSLPLPETQPDRLAALARLHGLDAPAPERARILELGCAQGGNLIPLAWRWPQSRCVGIELSAVQARAGEAFIRQMGIANARIVHANLAALPDDLGEFDYILAHGVFSWVPPEIQSALLEVCRRHLAPRGLAYVSFNVAAGWAPLLPLRAALLAGTDAGLPPAARVEAARALLPQLVGEFDDERVQRELAYLNTASPSYLFHEYLADFNQPTTFADFVESLQRHGLRYVGEAGGRRACPEAMPGSEAARLAAEAALDAMLEVRFRRAILCRSEVQTVRQPDPERLDGLFFHADLGSDDEIDLASETTAVFVSPAGHRFPVSDPALKAACMLLSARYPGTMSYAELAEATISVLEAYGGAPFVASRFAVALLDAVLLGAVSPTCWAGQNAEALGARPRAHALAHAQATTAGWIVTGARHVAVDVDEMGRALIALADGQRDFEALLGALASRLPHVSTASLAAALERQLWLYQRQGLFEAG